jgi:hypothetical protein
MLSIVKRSSNTRASTSALAISARVVESDSPKMAALASAFRFGEKDPANWGRTRSEEGDRSAIVALRYKLRSSTELMPVRLLYHSMAEPAVKFIPVAR